MSIPENHRHNLKIQQSAQPQHLEVLQGGLERMESSVRSRVNDSLKRVFDVVFASFLLLLFSPVMAVVALAIKLNSPGPAVFKQERVARGEKSFYIYKFRTMVNNAEAQTGPTWVQKGDSRITPLGKMLRDTHLDELLQLWNVLVGDMSFVGPRPERPEFVEQFKAQGVVNYEARFLTRPGITGYAQLQNSNPSIEEIQEKTDADVWYVANWTPWLDVVLITQTAWLFVTSILQALRLLPKKQKPAPQKA